METKVDCGRMDRIRRKFGFLNWLDMSVVGSRGGLSLVWKSDVKVSLHSMSINHVIVLVSFTIDNNVWQFTGFYSALSTADRKQT